MTPPIHILLADDHRIVRQGLRRILEENSRMEVVGEASDGREAVQMALDKEPDVIIMDVAMPHLGGWRPSARFPGGSRQPKFWC